MIQIMFGMSYHPDIDFTSYIQELFEIVYSTVEFIILLVRNCKTQIKEG